MVATCIIIVTVGGNIGRIEIHKIKLQVLPKGKDITVEGYMGFPVIKNRSVENLDSISKMLLKGNLQIAASIMIAYTRVGENTARTPTQAGPCYGRKRNRPLIRG